MTCLSTEKKNELINGKLHYLDYFIIDLRENKDFYPIKLASLLRKENLKVSFPSIVKKLNGALKMADRLNANKCLIFDDYNQNKIIVKDMKLRAQEIIDINDDVLSYLLKGGK